MNVIDHVKLVLARMLAVPIANYPRVVRYVLRRHWHAITAPRSIKPINNFDLSLIN